MLLNLDVKIPLEIREGGKLKEKLEVYYRDYTKEEKKKFNKIVKDFKNLFMKVSKYGQKEASLNKRIELAEKIGNFDKAFSLVEERDNLQNKIEEVAIELESLGGEDFEEKMAKKRFDTLISGEDKEKLREYAEIRTYKTILKLMDEQKAELEKKQSGE